MYDLKKEFDYFNEHKEEFLIKYIGKYIVIKNSQVIGSYDDMLEAINKTKLAEPLGTFIVQLCDPDNDTSTQTFHSRVAFVR